MYPKQHPIISVPACSICSIFTVMRSSFENATVMLWHWLYLDDWKSFMSLQHSVCRWPNITENRAGDRDRTLKKRRNDKDTRGRVWLMEKLFQKTVRHTQSDTLFNSWQPMSAHLCEKEAMNRGLGAFSDLLTNCNRGQLAQCACGRGFWADAAHFKCNFFFFFWMALLKVTCFQSHCLYQINPENEAYLSAWQLSFCAPANCTQKTTQSAFAH